MGAIPTTPTMNSKEMIERGWDAARADAPAHEPRAPKHKKPVGNEYLVEALQMSAAGFITMDQIKLNPITSTPLCRKVKCWRGSGECGHGR